jgi:DNA-binding NarL/FixJ family response regulator
MDGQTLDMRVVVADDDPLARRAIRAALRDGGITVVADAAEGHQAIAAARHHRPDVLLLDLGLPGPGASAVARRISSALPEVRVVVLAATPDDADAIRVLHAGASGFVSKDADIDALPRLLQAVVRGEAAITRTLTMRLIEVLRGVPTDARGLRPVRSELTNREWEVVDLLAAGLTTREVSETLVLTLDTVYTHVKNIMRKLGVSTRAAAVDAALALRAASVVRSPFESMELSEIDIDILLHGGADEVAAAV